MKLYMFRTIPLSIIRSVFTVHAAMVYVIHVCRQLSSPQQDQEGTLSEICRVSFQNKFEKSVHLVGFSIRICHDARSHERHDARSRERKITKDILRELFEQMHKCKVLSSETRRRHNMYIPCVCTYIYIYILCTSHVYKIHLNIYKHLLVLPPCRISSMHGHGLFKNGLDILFPITVSWNVRCWDICLPGHVS
jgi:hypothetical protein